MGFAADKYCASFGGVKLFVEEYAFERSASADETVLLNGSAALHNGGKKAARITLSGKAENSCVNELDVLLSSAEAVTIEYSGIIFEGAVLVSYACGGKSGCSENVTVKFACENAAEKAVEA